MTKVVQFPVNPPAKLGHRKARRRKKPNLEDFGQLNLFDQVPDNTPVLMLPKSESFFEEALLLDEKGDPGIPIFVSLRLLLILFDD